MQNNQQIDFLLAGGGLASATAAQTLAKQGARGRTVIVGAEPELPYNRPPLSKDYLRGETPKSEIFVQGGDFWQEHHVEVRTDDRVESVDPRAHSVRLAGGETLEYRRLLLATGAVLRMLRVPGADLAGVHYLRTVRDCDRIREAAQHEQNALTIGGGFIGAEVAASLRQLGLKMTILEPRPILWAHLFGDEMGRYFHDSMLAHGIEIVQDEVTSFEGQGGQVRRARTKGGRVLEAGIIVAGIGVDPDTRLASYAGLQVGRGVIVDEQMRTSEADIFAAGDCTEYYHPLYQERLHVQHWQNAIDTGEVAAMAMMDRGQPIRKAPYFFSDLFDIGMEYLGHAPRWDHVVLRGRPDDGSFGAYYVRDGRIIAALHVNNFDETDAARELVEAQAEVSPIEQRLRDRSEPLSAVAAMALHR